MFNNNKVFFWGALYGTLIGIGTALLLTPASGKDMRKMVRNGFRMSHPHATNRGLAAKKTKTASKQKKAAPHKPH